MLISLPFAFIFSHSSKQTGNGPFVLYVENSFFNLANFIRWLCCTNNEILWKYFMPEKIKYEFPINYVEKSWQNPKTGENKLQWKMDFHSSKTERKTHKNKYGFLFATPKLVSYNRELKKKKLLERILCKKQSHFSYHWLSWTEIAKANLETHLVTNKSSRKLNKNQVFKFMFCFCLECAAHTLVSASKRYVYEYARRGCVWTAPMLALRLCIMY